MDFYVSLEKQIYIGSDGAKVVGPRLLHSTQFGLLCPIHSPDGGNVGLHKHLSTSTHITSGCSGLPYINYLRNMKETGFKLLEECHYDYLSKSTKIFINGNWIGCTHNPLNCYNNEITQKKYIIDIYTSIYFNIRKNEITICSDAGRPIRPLFYLMEDKLSYERENIIEKYTNNDITWFEITKGFNKNKKITIVIITKSKVDNMISNSSIVEYIDTQAEGIKLAHSSLDKSEFIKNRVTILRFTIIKFYGKSNNFS